MKKRFLILYGILILAVTVGFMIFGEHPRDSRFYWTLLTLLIVGKLIESMIDKHEKK